MSAGRLVPVILSCEEAASSLVHVDADDDAARVPHGHMSRDQMSRDHTASLHVEASVVARQQAAA